MSSYDTSTVNDMLRSQDRDQPRTNSQDAVAAEPKTLVPGLDTLNELVACTIAGYPIHLARTLMQLGYEPLKPTNGRYPTIVGYLRYINRDRGFTAMYTGLPYHLSYVIAQKITYSSLDLLAPGKKHTKADDDDSGDLQDLIYEAMRESCLKVQTTLITYPIFTLGVSYITSFFLQTKGSLSCSEMYSGIIPRLIVEVAGVWAVKISWRLTRKYFKTRPSIEQQIISRAPPLVISTLLYPLNVVTTVMADNGRTNPKFDNWQMCYSYLSKMGASRRGSSLIWRYVEMPKKTVYYLN